MPQVNTYVLIPETSYVNPGNGAPYTVTGNAYPAASYYLSNQDLQTISYKLTGVTGNIVIEASLDSNTGNANWFNVLTVEANNTTISAFENVEGSFVYIRAKIEDFDSGTVQFVKASY